MRHAPKTEFWFILGTNILASHRVSTKDSNTLLVKRLLLLWFSSWKAPEGKTVAVGFGDVGG